MFSSTGDAADAMVIYYKNGQSQNIDLGSVTRIEFPGGTPLRTGASSELSPAAPMRSRPSIAECLDVAAVATHNGQTSSNGMSWRSESTLDPADKALDTFLSPPRTATSVWM